MIERTDAEWSRRAAEIWLKDHHWRLILGRWHKRSASVGAGLMLEEAISEEFDRQRDAMFKSYGLVDPKQSVTRDRGGDTGTNSVLDDLS